MRRSDSIFRNTAFNTVARVVDFLAGLAGFALLTRFLGVTDFGRLTFVMAYVSVFGLVVNLGLDHIIIREISKEVKRTAQIIGAAFRLKIWLLLFSAPLLIGGLFLFRFDKTINICIILFFLTLLVLRELFTVIAQAVFLACEKLEYRAITTFIFQVLRIGCILTVLLLKGGLIPLFAVTIIADLVQAYWTADIVRRRFAHPDFKVPNREVIYLFKQSIPIGIAFGFVQAFLQLEALILKGLRGDYENGLYASAYLIIATLIFVVVPIIWVLLPHLTRTFQNSLRDLKREGEFYLKCISAVMIPTSLIIGFYSTWIIVTVCGNEFRPAGDALAIVAGTFALRGLAYIFDLTFLAAGKQSLMALCAGIAFISKLVLELLLVPQYGYIGAAWGNLAAEIIAFITGYILVSRMVVNYNLYRILFKPLIGMCITFMILWFFPRLPLLGIPLGFIVCLLLILILGTFDKEESENIKSLLVRKLKRESVIAKG
jgi:O-antigen/teichoic acid export membrane protein